MSVIGIFGEYDYVKNRLLCAKIGQKNRVIVTEDNYFRFPSDLSKLCDVYVFKTDENAVFNEIDYESEETTFIYGLKLIKTMLTNNHVDRIEFYSSIPSGYSEFFGGFDGYEPCEEFISSGNNPYYVKSWNRNFHPEYAYLSLLKKVVKHGNSRQTRNAETFSLFGESIEFDLDYGFPLLTTKKMFFGGIVKELLWFLNGKTNVNELKDNGVHIWDGNTSREFLDGIGLKHYPEGCAGPIYGYQWRNFNAPYDAETMTPKESGYDQLMFCIKELQTNPTSRRMVMSGWNPCQIEQMCLPPCHVLYQFYVEGESLSCQLYQRSADLFLGLPFNIASTALMTTLIGKLTGYKPGKIRICIGDAHIYKSHIDNVFTQVKRLPLSFCEVEVDHFVSDPETQIREWKPEHIRITDYKSHGRLASAMVA